MRIEVTQDDIDQGVRCDGNACAVAVAIGRAIGTGIDAPWYGHISVCDDEIAIGSERFFVPTEVRQFIGWFDKGHVVNPFAFDLPIDDLVVPTYVE